jgi:DHA2 family methylenomycin A resistance protein-like MFS transporter
MTRHAPIRRSQPGQQDTLDSQDTTASRGTLVALISVCLGFFVIQLDVTIVNVALPAIQREIGGTVAGLQWIIDAYTLALASIMLTAGSTADRVGARKVFVAGLAMFAAGSAACAAAPALSVLIAARAVQGLGASALLPCSLALLVHQFPDPRARARALGVWGAMGSLGVALGPVIGGALVAAAGWRSIFGVNVPVCLLTVFLLRRHVTESPLNPARRLDLPGLLLGVASLAGLTAGFITAGQQGWLSPVPDGLLAAGLVAAWFFVRAERKQPAPMLPLHLFRSRPFSGATGIGVLFNGCLYGALLCLSLYLQQSRHESVLVTGLLLLPMSVVVGAGSLASGRLTGRLGPRPPMIAGLALGAAGMALLATAGTGTSLALVVTGSVLVGLVSLAMPAMTAVVVGAAGPEHAGVASGILNAARQSGGALGVAVLGALLTQGHALSLHLPLAVSAAGYLLAVALAWITIRDIRRLGQEGQPAYGVAGGQPLQALGHVVQGEPVADQRPDRAVGDQLAELPVAVRDGLRVLNLVQAPVQAHDRVVLDQHVVQRGGGDRAAGEADHQDPALERDALGRSRVGLAAHGVVDNVGAAASGHLLDDLDEVLPVPVHHHVRAQGARGLRLPLAADHADDPGPGRLAELDRAAAHPAGRGVHEQRLARRQPGPPVQAEPAGLVGDEERGGLRVIEAFRRGHDARGVHERELGEGAGRQRRAADHPVSGREPGHLGADRQDLAAQLDARGERQRRAHLVAAAAHEHVGEIGRGRAHPDQHLAGPGPRVGELGQRQNVARLAEPGYLPGLHWTSSIRCCKRFIPRSHRSVSLARSPKYSRTCGCGRIRNRPVSRPASRASATCSGSIASAARIICPPGPLAASMDVRTPCGQMQCTISPRCA